MSLTREMVNNHIKMVGEFYKMPDEQIIYLDDTLFEAAAKVYCYDLENNNASKVTKFSAERNGVKVRFVRKGKEPRTEVLNAQAYQNGFRDGISVNQKFPQTLTIMGYSLEKITELICEDHKDRIKMTREEAEKKLNPTHNIVEARFLIAALEALGLIKFDEKEKRKYIFFPHPDGAGRDNVGAYQDDVIKTLNEYGYDVIKRT